jgi:RimJ/RimL family protein N-acetyltransferase
MTVYTIQKASQDDLDGLIAVHTQSWLDAYPNEKEGVSYDFISNHVKSFSTETGREKRAGYIQESHDNPDYYLRIAKDSERTVVGFVDAQRGDTPELCGLYIGKSAYGSGLARQLVEPALAWLGTTNDIKLTVVSYNHRAQAFYRKLGFEPVPGSNKFYNNKPLTVIDMIRKGDKS